MDNEEKRALLALTQARIEMLEAKALKRLTMTEEEKEQFRLMQKLKNDPSFQEIVSTLLIASSKKNENGNEESGVT